MSKKIKDMIFSGEIEIMALGISVVQEYNGGDLADLLNVRLSAEHHWQRLTTSIGIPIFIGHLVVCIINYKKSWIMLLTTTHISLSQLSIRFATILQTQQRNWDKFIIIHA